MKDDRTSWWSEGRHVMREWEVETASFKDLRRILPRFASRCGSRVVRSL